MTPDLTRKAGILWLGSCRGEEIQAWLRANNHQGPFAALDDGGDMAAIGKHHFQTDLNEGLTRAVADRLIAFINRTGSGSP